MDDDFDEEFLYGGGPRASAPAAPAADAAATDAAQPEAAAAEPAQAEDGKDDAAEAEEGEEEDDEMEDGEDSEDDFEIVLDPHAGRILDLRNPNPTKVTTLGHGLGAAKAAPPVLSLKQLSMPVQTTTEYAPPARPGSQQPPPQAATQQQQQQPSATSTPQLQAGRPAVGAAPAAQTVSAPASAHVQAVVAAAEAPTPFVTPSGELPNHFGRLNATFSQRAFPAVHIPPSEPGVDLYAPPLLPDGRSVYEIEIEMLDRKDWRMPGADNSDWFNYGFDEFTWSEYTRRRREMEEMRNNPQQAMQMAMQQQGMFGFDPMQQQGLMNGMMFGNAFGMDPNGMGGAGMAGMPTGPRADMPQQQQQGFQHQLPPHQQIMHAQQQSLGNQRRTDSPGALGNGGNDDEQKPNVGEGGSDMGRNGHGQQQQPGRGGFVGVRGGARGRGAPAFRGGRGGLPLGPAGAQPSPPKGPSGRASLPQIPTGPRKKDLDRPQAGGGEDLDYGAGAGGGGGGGGSDGSRTRENSRTRDGPSLRERERERDMRDRGGEREREPRDWGDRRHGGGPPGPRGSDRDRDWERERDSRDRPRSARSSVAPDSRDDDGFRSGGGGGGLSIRGRGSIKREDDVGDSLSRKRHASGEPGDDGDDDRLSKRR